MIVKKLLSIPNLIPGSKFQLQEYLYFFFNPDKKATLLSYILTTIFCSLFILIQHTRKNTLESRIDEVIKVIKVRKPKYLNEEILIIFFISTTIFLSYLFLLSSKITGILFSSIVLFIYLYYFLFQFKIKSFGEKKLALTCSTILPLLVFGSFICSPHPLLNEFFKIPSYLNTGERVSSSLILENKSSVYSTLGKNFLRRNVQLFCSKQSYLHKDFFNGRERPKFSKSEHTRHFFLQKYEDSNYICPISGLEDLNTQIVLNYNFLGKEKAENYIHHLTKKRLNASPLEDDQISLDIQKKALDRWVLHHHNFIISPVHKLLSGEKYKELHSQYGLGFLFIFENLFKHVVDFNLENYFKIYFTTFLLYFFLNIFVIFRISNSITITSMSITLLFCSILLIGHDLIILGPGINPLRHFLDFSLFYCLYKYFKDKSLFHFVLGSILSLITLLINLDLGLVLFISFWVSVFLTSLREIDKYTFLKELFFFLLVLACSIAIFKYFLPSNEYSKFYLAGILGFKINHLSLKLLTIFIIGLIVLSYKVWESSYSNYLVSVFIFSTMVFTGSLAYYVWSGLIDHFYIVSFSLVMITLSVYLITSSSKKAFISLKIQPLINLTILFFLCFNTARFFYQRNKYASNISNLKTYSWNFEKATLLSKTPPTPFQESIELIKSYEEKKFIFMISKYDHILPLLSNRPLAYKFPQMSWFIFTEQHIDDIINMILSSKPRYLFVDNDINISPFFNVIDSQHPIFGYLHNETVWRAQRIKLLTDIFDGVKNYYRKVKSKGLITVYEKI